MLAAISYGVVHDQVTARVCVEYFTALPPICAGALPASVQPRFMADWWAHNASYASGILGGLVVAVISYRRRGS